MNELYKEIDRLRAVNGELLEACKALLAVDPSNYEALTAAENKARKAIQEAEGGE